MEKMRCGFTTGSCAAAAAKAAAFMLFTGKEKTEITIRTPGGASYHTEILDIERQETAVSCAVKKDGGSDPDVTTGSFIYAKVSAEDMTEESGKVQVIIDGGIGVGRVTKPGLDQPVGNAAINHVPREMIAKEVEEVCEAADFHGILRVEIYVPGGEELAKKTFNPRLGIKGGISILGTTGIVEPMSEKALLDTILVELKQHRAMGKTCIVVSPGNYGRQFMQRRFGYDLEQSVKCSNFIGKTIDMAVECGFREILFAGHIGKLIKVSGGMMNTHSKEGDCRMELLAGAALLEGIDADSVCQILACATTEEALMVVEKTNRFYDVMKRLVEKICFYLNKRAEENVRIECMMYSNTYGLLAESDGAEEMLRKIMSAGRDN